MTADPSHERRKDQGTDREKTPAARSGGSSSALPEMTNEQAASTLSIDQLGVRLAVAEKNIDSAVCSVKMLEAKTTSLESRVTRLFTRQEAVEARQTVQDQQITTLTETGHAIGDLVDLVRREQKLNAQRHAETAKQFQSITTALVDMTALITGAQRKAQDAADAVSIHAKKESLLTRAAYGSVGLWSLLVGAVGLWLWNFGHLETLLQHILEFIRALRGA